MTTLQLFNKAKAEADSAAIQALLDAPRYSNGSEAWQAVQFSVDGRSKISRELRKLGVEKDYYWGHVLTTHEFDNFYAEEAWTEKFAEVFNENGISSRAVERLL